MSACDGALEVYTKLDLQRRLRLRQELLKVLQDFKQNNNMIGEDLLDILTSLMLYDRSRLK